MKILILKNLVLGLAFFIGPLSQASINLHCKTPFKKYSFKIQEKNLVLHDKSILKNRSIASQDETFNQKFYLNGENIQIYIQNIKNPSELNDVLVITDSEKHKLTLPLKCK